MTASARSRNSRAESLKSSVSASSTVRYKSGCRNRITLLDSIITFSAPAILRSMSGMASPRRPCRVRTQSDRFAPATRKRDVSLSPLRSFSSLKARKWSSPVSQSQGLPSAEQIPWPNCVIFSAVQLNSGSAAIKPATTLVFPTLRECPPITTIAILLFSQVLCALRTPKIACIAEKTAFCRNGLQLTCDFLERALARPLPHCDTRRGAAHRHTGKAASRTDPDQHCPHPCPSRDSGGGNTRPRACAVRFDPCRAVIQFFLYRPVLFLPDYPPGRRGRFRCFCHNGGAGGPTFVAPGKARVADRKTKQRACTRSRQI